MFNPPITGNKELDAFLSQLMLEGTSGAFDGVTVDTNTGVISDANGNLLGYLYRYLAVKYADDNLGDGMSNVPTNKAYYGIKNSDSSTESSNPADYRWFQVTGGFGTTKFLWYQSVGGRKVNFRVATTVPAVGWLVDPGTAIDADIVTSINAGSLDSFSSFFTPPSLQVPRTGDPLTPNFTGVTPKLYAVNNSVNVPFVSAQTDADGSFVNNSWRIGGSSSTGNADIVYTNVTMSAPTDGGDFASWAAPSAMSATPATIFVPVRFKNSAGTVVQASPSQIQLFFVDQGATGDQNAYVNLYQWSIGTPGNPNGSSTFTWATGANSGYTGGNGWSTSIPANPGTPLLVLWIATKKVTAVAGATTSTISWTSGFSISGAGQNGDTGPAGFQNARPTVYQWAITIPSISGTSTYTWSNGSFTAPSGWSKTISAAPSAGYTLWAASVNLVDSSTVSTSTINWTTASIVASGYSAAGTAGASARVTFARMPTDLNPVPVSGNITTSGNTSYPTSGQSLSTWGFSATWGASDPNPSSIRSLYQADGIYDPSTGNTVWSTPYLSMLKVGALQAVSTNTGNLTISGTLQSNNAAISGSTMASGTSGGVLYSTGLFAFGNSTTNIAFNGSQMTLNGNVVATNNINVNAITAATSVTGGAGTVFGYLTTFNLRTISFFVPAGTILNVFFTALKTAFGAGDINVILNLLTSSDVLVATFAGGSGNELVQTMGPGGDKVTAVFTGAYAVPYDGNFKIEAIVSNNFGNSWTASYLNMIAIGSKR